ncbi:hypothetical protein PN499_05375 [Kamptonema animale CS-326]|uniref:hypothetical protein n=1 Tax=Kamptonema animale TaxID=92934 RepID=UPI00232AE48B|nr:hypothetical protein [Kamptonema animale]MDB9510607.1 hypothetical protein [Kamptonema animale CS-326]
MNDELNELTATSSEGTQSEPAPTTDLSPLDIAEFLAPDDPIKAIWENLSLPKGFTVNEFFAKSLSAAAKAADKVNATLPEKSRIQGYPQPVNGAIKQDSQGTLFFERTASVRSNILVDLEFSVSPLG